MVEWWGGRAGGVVEQGQGYWMVARAVESCGENVPRASDSVDDSIRDQSVDLALGLASV